MGSSPFLHLSLDLLLDLMFVLGCSYSSYIYIIFHQASQDNFSLLSKITPNIYYLYYLFRFFTSCCIFYIFIVFYHLTKISIHPLMSIFDSIKV